MERVNRVLLAVLEASTLPWCKLQKYTIVQSFIHQMKCENILALDAVFPSCSLWPPAAAGLAHSAYDSPHSLSANTFSK